MVRDTGATLVAGHN